MTPSDEARITALIGMIAVNAQRGNATFARAHASELVAVATAAAYRHVEAKLRAMSGQTALGRESLLNAAGFCCGWAEKAEAEKGQP